MEAEGQLTGKATRSALEAHLARAPKPAADALGEAGKEELGGGGDGDAQVALDLREALSLSEVSPFAGAPQEGGKAGRS